MEEDNVQITLSDFLRYFATCVLGLIFSVLIQGLGAMLLWNNVVVSISDAVPVLNYWQTSSIMLILNLPNFFFNFYS